jgi:PadR family transcriptional regulator, regulatory protein AphA
MGASPGSATWYPRVRSGSRQSGAVVSLRHAVLGLLAHHPGCGYDLLKKFRLSLANVWPATQSQLYGELGKLLEAGLIEVIDVGARGRREYAVTDDGRAELQRWMTSPQGDPPFRSAPLLRVSLLGQQSPAGARDYLHSLRRHAESEHSRYQQIRDAYEWSGSDGFFARLALENGLRFTRMEVDWADWALGRLDRRPGQ